MIRQRLPKGYRGINHETIGSDILAVLQAVTMRHLLGEENVHQIEKVDPNGWYPISWLLDLMWLLEQKFGENHLVRMGRALFVLSHQERVLQVAKSAKDIVYGINGMYHHANRGEDIGGWEVLAFRPGYALLEKTTPHHCMMEEGILKGALTAVGAPSMIRQVRCRRKEADCCHYEISSANTEHWG